jgi:Grx4 family monothiol glutaredoxin
MEALSSKYNGTSISFISIDAEQIPELVETYGVGVVPSFIAIHSGQIIGKVEGANPPDVMKLVKKLADLPPPPINTTTKTTNDKIIDNTLNLKLTALINTAPVMLFMKGSPSAPRCGFSRQIVEILQSQSVPFASFDILTDEDIRSGLKVLSDWPTYPQLYVNGELIGGLDIVKELVQEGNLKEQLGL